MNDKILPIGSVIQLHNGEVKLMILSRFHYIIIKEQLVISIIRHAYIQMEIQIINVTFLIKKI